MMFESSNEFLFFDYFRIPYQVGQSGSWGRPAGDGAWGRVATTMDPSIRELYWPRFQAGVPALLQRSTAWGRYELAGIPIYGHVVTDAAVPTWIREDARWHRTDPIVSDSGEAVASVWRHADGGVWLPFDPGEVLEAYWSERYVRAGTSRAKALLRAGALKTYYGVRPLVPRSAQIAARRAFARIQRPPSFPGWPIETALIDLCEWMFRLVADFADRPVPWLAPWPNGHTWSFVLTHDVETAEGVARIDVLRDVERHDGFTSSWNFVPLRYQVTNGTLRMLRDEGCEIGVHGLYHDGKDLASMRMLRTRLPHIRRYAEEWGAIGFRSPATQRVWEWMPLLGFDYDSSSSDTDPYEPQPGGCLSHLPFMNGSMVELPITLPQDHTLFAILEHEDAGAWMKKMDHIRSSGGMALVLTHPDYANDQQMVDGYRTLLGAASDDPTVWRALPREVSAWWRRRADSNLELLGDTWMIRGPAAQEGSIRFAEPAGSATRTKTGDNGPVR